MKKCFLLFGTLIFLSSCTTPEAVSTARMLGGSSQALLYMGCRAVSGTSVEFEFSQAVTIKRLIFEPEISIASIEDGSTVKVTLEESAEPGSLITVDLLAEDENNNSINVLVSFRARNSRMPGLIINEICTEYSKPKTEYIEFKMKTDGNLGAMRVIIMGNTNSSSQTIYEFQPVEVKENDYVVLHLRTVDENARDEYGINIDESGGSNASASARDFWIPGSSKLIHKEAAAIYVLDQSDDVLAAVMISSDTNPWWNKDYFAEAANFLFSRNAWLSPDGQRGGPADAVRSTGTTNTRTICRDETAENTNTRADWYVTVTSGATAGRPNNPNRYSN
ncbi:MAG: hypothetical protein FWB83_01965 [Treponema sp.]|nr:hypothetical protein [Treponema sp.]